MQLDRRAIITGLLLLWLCLTGSYLGWSSPWLVFINLVVWAGLLVWLGVSLPGQHTPDMAMLAMMLAAVISGAVNHTWHGLQVAAIVAGYLAVYRLAGHANPHAGALLALAGYYPLAWLLPENSNVEAMNILGLTLLAAPAAGLFAIHLMGLAAVGFAINASTGALLALVAAIVVYVVRLDWLTRPQRIGASVLSLAIVPTVEPASIELRLQFWRDAWGSFVNSPIVGIGPGHYASGVWYHAHNIVASTAAEMGLIGLAALGWLAWAIWRRPLPTWASAVIAAFSVWPMVDEPLRFWGAGAMFMLAMGADA